MSVSFYPGLPCVLPRFRKFCVVAVSQANGAYGVGICPCAAARHLSGLPDLGEVRFFVVENSDWFVENTPYGWAVHGGRRIEKGVAA